MSWLCSFVEAKNEAKEGGGNDEAEIPENGLLAMGVMMNFTNRNQALNQLVVDL